MRLCNTCHSQSCFLFLISNGNTLYFQWVLWSKPISTTLLTWRGHTNSEKVETLSFVFLFNGTNTFLKATEPQIWHNTGCIQLIGWPTEDSSPESFALNILVFRPPPTQKHTNGYTTLWFLRTEPKDSLSQKPYKLCAGPLSFWDTNARPYVWSWINSFFKV